jgi:hypothetical protein
MTPEKVISMFERQYLEGKAPLEVEYVCAGFADWLSSAWEYLDGEEKVLLMSVVRGMAFSIARTVEVDQYNCSQDGGWD